MQLKSQMAAETSVRQLCCLVTKESIVTWQTLLWI